MLEKELRAKIADRIINEMDPYDMLIIQFNINTAKTIRARRKELNMTQEDLAEKSGLSRITISQLENKKRVPSLDALIRIGTALDLSLQYSRSVPAYSFAAEATNR